MNAPLNIYEFLAVVLTFIFYGVILFCLNESPDGPFPSYPHSGFYPDCPQPAPLNRP